MSRVNERIDRVLSIFLTVAAVVIAGVLVRREFFARDSGPLQISTEPEFTSNWKSLLSQGHLIGRSDALMHIVEFSDLECPFCARFHVSFNFLREKYGDDVALTFIHYPLSYHKFAMPAARASECASKQDRFAQFIDLVFRHQDSLGQIEWAAYAERAGVPDAGAFARCLEDTTSLPRITAGLQLAEKLRIQGTPTVLVNGWKYPVPPTQAQLIEMVDSLRVGANPFGKRSSR